MATDFSQKRPVNLWRLAARQHGVIARTQLLDAGLSESAIRHRLRKGRLHLILPGVYAVGRAQLGRRGRLLAAVLSCGRGAVLSHASAGALWGICAAAAAIEVTLPAERHVERPGVRVHRTAHMPDGDLTVHDGIPLTAPVRTLIDLGQRLSRAELEAAVNAADKLGLTDSERLRDALAARPGERGVPKLRELLDAETFVLTDSELERRLLPIARSAGLPTPETGVVIDGYRVDFFWRRLRLIVETDGLRYHRTPSSQGRDRLRDQAHTESGYTTLRFTYAQVAQRPKAVERTLSRVARRLEREARGEPGDP